MWLLEISLHLGRASILENESSRAWAWESAHNLRGSVFKFKLNMAHRSIKKSSCMRSYAFCMCVFVLSSISLKSSMTIIKNCTISNKETKRPWIHSCFLSQFLRRSQGEYNWRSYAREIVYSGVFSPQVMEEFMRGGDLFMQRRIEIYSECLLALVSVPVFCAVGWI